jgi:hypothetical protein
MYIHRIEHRPQATTIRIFVLKRSGHMHLYFIHIQFFFTILRKMSFVLLLTLFTFKVLKYIDKYHILSQGSQNPYFSKIESCYNNLGNNIYQNLPVSYYLGFDFWPTKNVPYEEKIMGSNRRISKIQYPYQFRIKLADLEVHQVEFQKILELCQQIWLGKFLENNPQRSFHIFPIMKPV